MAQAYYTPYTIASGQVPSTQTNFPTLVYLNDARFKTIGNGGHVANANGYDIRFYSDAGLTTALTYQQVPGTYSASGGTGEFHVLIASMADAVTIYVGCGDVALSSDGSSTSTWDTNYKGVYHLGDGSSISVADSSQSSNTATLQNTPTATTGQIGGGAAFVSSSNQRIETANIFNAAVATVSVWVNIASAPAAAGSLVGVAAGNGNNPSDKNLTIGTDRKISFQAYDGGTQTATSTGTISTGAWHYVVGVANGTNILIYIDGAQDGSVACGNTYAAYASAGFQINGILAGGVYGYSTCSMDEARVSNIARSANWITTEYNNQSAPNTFWTMGTEVAVGGAPIATFASNPMTILLPTPRRTQVVII